MNILFFMTPKEKVAYIYDTYTIRQISKRGIPRTSSSTSTKKEIRRQISEGISLVHQNHPNLSKAEEYSSPSAQKARNYGIYVNTKIDDLIVSHYYFIPVLDDATSLGSSPERNHSVSVKRTSLYIRILYLCMTGTVIFFQPIPAKRVSFLFPGFSESDPEA